MHFWIDKRSQGCVRYSNRSRYQIPPSISGYGRNQRNLSNGYFPKPMVTPVRRFQSIESVANNGLRFTRSPGYHVRQSQQCSPTVHYSEPSNRLSEVERGLDLMSPSVHSSSAHARQRDNSKLKCGIVIFFFAVVTFFLAAAKYLFNGFPLSLGVEALIFCLLVLFVLIIGGLITICEATRCSTSNPNLRAQELSPVTREQHSDNEDVHMSLRQTTAQVETAAELPPPPYHIAVMLSPQNDINSIQIIRDSPPPTYEKAVT